MKYFSLIGFVVAFVLFSAASVAVDKVSPPQFSAYAVDNAYVGNPANVVLATEAERMYRTRLREASHSPPNFAGDYVLTTWGCGSSCVTGAVVSRKTGKVVWLPGSVCCWYGDDEQLAFHLNSRLLVASGVMNEESAYGAHYYEFTGTEFKHLLTVPLEE